MNNRIISVITLALLLSGALMWPASAQEDGPPPPPPRDEMINQDTRPGRDRMERRDRMRMDGEGRGSRSRGSAMGPGGRMFGGDGDHSKSMPQLSDEEIEIAAGILRDYRPEFADRFEALRESNPEQAMRMLARIPMVRRLMSIKQSDPEMYETHLADFRLGAETQRLSREYTKQTPRDPEQLKKIRSLVEKHFDLRQRMREQELKRLEEKVEKFKNLIERRAASREQLIEVQLGNLTGEKNQPQW